MVALKNFIHRLKRPTYNTSKFNSRTGDGVLESSLALGGENEFYFFVMIMKQWKSDRAIFVKQTNGCKRAWVFRWFVILQHDWPIEQCLFHIRIFFGGKTKSPCFDLFIHWLIKQITNTYRNYFSRSYENRSKHICITWRFFYSFFSGFIHLVCCKLKAFLLS